MGGGAVFILSPVKHFIARSKTQKSPRETWKLPVANQVSKKMPVKHVKLPVANLAKSCPWNLKVARGKSEKSARETWKLPVANSGFFCKNLPFSKLLPALETRLSDQPPSPESNFKKHYGKKQK